MLYMISGHLSRFTSGLESRTPLDIPTSMRHMPQLYLLHGDSTLQKISQQMQVQNEKLDASLNRNISSDKQNCIRK